MFREANQIKVKAMCLFVHKGRVLAAPGHDSIKNETFYRLLGGTMEFFETAEETIRREIKEEINSEIENLRFLKLIENRFEFDGERGHQITFLYSGDLADKALYDQEKIKIIDTSYVATWVPIEEILSGKTKLYPALNYENYFR